jgi:DNA polymerase I
MPYKFDYRDGDVLAWTLTNEGAEPERIEDYTPTIYVAAEDTEPLTKARKHLKGFPTVEHMTFESAGESHQQLRDNNVGT